MADAAFITGGSKRLGAAIAERLAAAGYDLVLQTRDRRSVAQSWLDRLTAGGRAVALVELDLEATDRLPEAMDGVFSRHGNINLIVNNASRFQPDDFATVTEAGLLAHFRVNAFAPLAILQSFARLIGRGAVVNILDAKLAWPNADFLSYTLAKFALANLTDLAARHYAPAIRVNGVAPGLTLISPFQDEARFAREKAKLPLGGTVGPADIAEAVAYLAAARHVTGEIIHVDDGERHMARQKDPSRA